MSEDKSVNYIKKRDRERAENIIKSRKKMKRNELLKIENNTSLIKTGFIDLGYDIISIIIYHITKGYPVFKYFVKNHIYLTQICTHINKYYNIYV